MRMFAAERASAINRSGRFTSRRAATAATRFHAAAPNSSGRARPEEEEEEEEEKEDEQEEDLSPKDQLLSATPRSSAPAVESLPVFSDSSCKR